MSIDREDYDFAIYFKIEEEKGGEKKPKIFKVEPPPGEELKIKKLKDSPLEGIDELDYILVAGKPDNSPCCIVWGGRKYCWC